jgi:hypothetical protein
MSTALSKGERQRLVEVEAAIERSFIEIGNALREIRDSRLYRATHRNFDSYRRERWHSAAEVATMVVNAGPAPKSERQARELVVVFRDLRARFGQGVTPQVIREIVTDFWEARARGMSYFSSVSQEWHTPETYVAAGAHPPSRLNQEQRMPLTFELNFQTRDDAEAARREAGAMHYGAKTPWSTDDVWVLEVSGGDAATLNMHLTRLDAVAERHDGRLVGHH